MIKQTNSEQKSLTFNVINKKQGVSSKYYDYKETLRTFLEKKCFTKEENIEAYKDFHSNYPEYLDLKLSVAIDKFRNLGNPIYKELLLGKSFEGSVCTFSLDQKIKNMRKAGYLDLFCDEKRVLRKHYKDISKAILSIMRIKNSDVLFNGNATFVNKNVRIANSSSAYFKVSIK